MAKEFSEAEINKALFLHLVMMFSATAMQQLGKLVNPATGKAEVDLQGAQASIDILSMLAAKVKGNIDKEEEQLIRETITTLQMNYVETAQDAGSHSGSPKPTEEGGAGSVAGSPADRSGADGAAPEGAAAAGKAPKFHRSYGEK